MQYRPLGKSGIDASAICLGAWAIGGWMWGGQDEEDSIKTIHAAIDAGINIIDTAPMYGMGESERVVGKAIKGRRDKVIIATKCGMRWDLDEPKGRAFFKTDEDAISPDGAKQVYVYNGPESVKYEVDQSLQRLGVDHIDLLQTHWQEETTPIEETAGAIKELIEAGKVRAFGPCNASIDQIERYRSVLGVIATDQEKYSMLDRSIEEDKLPYLAEHDIALLAYSPLANGLLTGKMTADRTFPPNDLRSQRARFTVENRRIVNEALDQIRPFAEYHKVTLAQMVIAWTIAQAGATHALVGARHPQQAIENAAAGSVYLSDDELAQIAMIIDGLEDKVGSSSIPQSGVK
ncbi:MAG: aldo/keto reductase [Phycisphaera sp.]|nr:aldo/keto reductase [Phycisphaera sp.]